MSQSFAADEPSVEDHDRPVGFVEPRWPVALAISVFIAITITLRVAEPHRESLGPHWLVPSVEIAMLAVLLLADPTRVSAHRTWLRPLALSLVFALGVAAMVSTGVLITDLIRGGNVTESGGPR